MDFRLNLNTSICRAYKKLSARVQQLNFLLNLVAVNPANNKIECMSGSAQHSENTASNYFEMLKAPTRYFLYFIVRQI